MLAGSLSIKRDDAGHRRRPAIIVEGGEDGVLYYRGSVIVVLG
jgi:hypothetical protein